MKVPTMRELEKAARVQDATAYYHDGAVVVKRWYRPVDLGGVVMLARAVSTRFHFRADIPQSKLDARFLAGRHIEALKEAQEAGL